ncbi:hypothetical protein GE061_011351 [Apolygus lucorum]|uniref:Reverse transcriptase domain-containing protein n=1 Tax=Apolygus lucorum TaxID=248454 RepID=A0A8S9XX57_APOLU|nr:hypothetical protein GE061_011351 [Apolygus lucorum]
MLLSILQQRASATAEVTRFFNDLFDSLNGYRETPEGGGVGLRCRVQRSREEMHLNFWSAALEKLQSLKFLPKSPTSPPCSTVTIQGWIRTVNAVQLLWTTLKEEIPFDKCSYLVPRRLNQDPLENLFGSIRSKCGSNVNPSAYQFTSALKTCVVNKLADDDLNKGNCVGDVQPQEILESLQRFLVPSANPEGREPVPASNSSLPTNYSDSFAVPRQVIVRQDCTGHRGISCAYVCGFSVSRLLGKHSCEQCRIGLVAASHQEYEALSLIEQREFSTATSGLSYPSRSIFVMFDHGLKLTHEVLERESYSCNIRQCIIALLSKELDFAWWQNHCPEHTNHIFEAITVLLVPLQQTHSTLNNLAELHLAIENARLKKQATLCLFLDIKGAYNRVDPLRLRYLLQHKGVPGYLTEWFVLFLTEKIYTDGINSVIGCQGIDQGSTVGPSLFNIYVSDVGRNARNVHVTSFADDYMIYLSGESIRECRQLLAEDFLLIEKQLSDLNLTINFSKTKYMIFPIDPKNEIQNLNSMDIITSSGTIQAVTEYRYLGINITPELDGLCHAKKMVERCKRDVDALRFMKGSNWGNHPDTQTDLLNAAIRPKFEYAFPIYSWLNKGIISKFQVVQNMAVRSITGAVKTSPISSIHAISGIQYVQARAEKLTLRLMSKLYCSSEIIRSLSNGLINLTEERCPPRLLNIVTLLKKVKSEVDKNQVHILTDAETRFRLPTDYAFKGYETIPSIEKKSTLSALETKALTMEFLNTKYSQSDVVLACDGSKTDSRAAAAFICQQHLTQTGFRLPDISSCYFTEYLALIKALEHLVSHHKSCTNALILTDSRSTISEINNLRPGAYIPPHFQKLISYVSEFTHGKRSKLSIQWVPSHVGILANELADRCAKESLLREIIDPNTTIPFVELRRSWHRIAEDTNLNVHRQKRVTGGTWTASFLGSPCSSPWYMKKDIPIKEITRTNRILIGHGNNRQFQFRMKNVPSPNCR